jgi:hypothetical protein
MQVKPFEVYVLCRNRSTVVGLEFLDAFVPSRKPVADEFLYPEFGAGPQTFYHTPDEVMRRLEAEPQESYSIYWDGGDSGYALQGMLFYTEDGAMVAGLVTAGTNYSEPLLDVTNIVGGRFGFITSENRPPDTQTQFISTCRDSVLTSLVDGQIRSPSNR